MPRTEEPDAMLLIGAVLLVTVCVAMMVPVGAATNEYVDDGAAASQPLNGGYAVELPPDIGYPNGYEPTGPGNNAVYIDPNQLYPSPVQIRVPSSDGMKFVKFTQPVERGYRYEVLYGPPMKVKLAPYVGALFYQPKMQLYFVEESFLSRKPNAAFFATRYDLTAIQYMYVMRLMSLIVPNGQLPAIASLGLELQPTIRTPETYYPSKTGTALLYKSQRVTAARLSPDGSLAVSVQGLGTPLMTNLMDGEAVAVIIAVANRDGVRYPMAFKVPQPTK